MPVGINVLGAAYAFSTGDIAFDPVMQIEDATVDMHTLVVSYSQ